MTPLLPCLQLGRQLGLSRLFIKDESHLPGGSFKARGMTLAVSMAKHLGITRVAVPTAGNAGGALALYSARAGMECFVFMPDDTPKVNQLEAVLAGATLVLSKALINDLGKIVRAWAEHMKWFDVSTLREPYRLEGKKTMGLELAEQLGWRLPQVILYPTGGGTGLVGMWKAFNELEAIGWLKRPFPRMMACQSDGCAPIVRAFEQGERFATLFEPAHTRASGLRVPSAVADFMMLDVIRDSGGLAIAGREPRIDYWMKRVASSEGIAICPETAICFDCLEMLVERAQLRRDEEIVVFNTGAAQKYADTLDGLLPKVSYDPEQLLRDWPTIHATHRSARGSDSVLPSHASAPS
jgi:threonine synthase